MEWDFTGREIGPLDIPPPKFGEPMSAEALAGCCEWLNRSIKREPADPSLLTIGLRQGRLLEAGYFDLPYGQGMLFTVPDREARLVSPAQLCVIRLLALPGWDCEWWFDRSTKKDLPDEEQRWYLKFSRRHGVSALRIFANAMPGQVVKQKIKKRSENHLGHKDLQPSNLKICSRIAVVREGKPMRRIYRGRQDAIDCAARAFGSGVRDLDIGAKEYRALLDRAFLVLDKQSQNEIIKKD